MNAIFLGCICIIVKLLFHRVFTPNGHIPLVGFRSNWEPDFVLRLRFTGGAFPIIEEGYKKFKDTMFRLGRNDKDLLVISNKYVDELRALPEQKLNSIEALVHNMGGKYGGTHHLLGSNLHTRILQTRLTPNLANLTPILKDELEYALTQDAPECGEWVEVELFQMLLMIVARLSSRVLVGDLCRNKEWLRNSIAFSEDNTKTCMILKWFPPILYPIIAALLPPTRGIRRHETYAKALVVPIINERRAAEKSDLGYRKPMDVLQWMMDGARSPMEKDPTNLAGRALVLSLAAVHTSTMACGHALYDLIARPEYLKPLREEVFQVLMEDGGLERTSLHKLRKLDSFFKESQRLSPPSLLGFHRIVKMPLTLHDGTRIPVGTQLCLASYQIARDAAFSINAETFDGFRYYKRRLVPEEAQKHQFATTDKHHLNFGHGKYACPGRFFASNELKLIIARLLLEYDFKYPEGKGRPENMNIDEFLYPDPSARLLMKRRSGEERRVLKQW